MTEVSEVQTLSGGVSRTVSLLQHQFLDSELPSARARLATLRAAVDEEPGETAEVWQMVLDSLPERYIGQGDEASAGEWAAHLSLTLYAIHQRGNSMPVHVPGRSFGYAVGALMRDRTDSTKRLYDALISATNFPTRRHYLRSIVGLLSTDSKRGGDLALDYGRLASDLFSLQFAEYRPQLLRRWGRDFHRAFTRKAQDSDDSES